MSRSGWKKIGIGLAALGVAVGVWASGLLELAKEPERLQTALRDLGGLGMFAYVAVFALTQPLGMPGIALCLVASFIWPPWVAWALAMSGILLSSSLSFGFSRAMGREWVAKKLPPRLRAWDERIERHGLFAIILLRLLMFGSQPVHFLLGISKVRFATFLLGSFLGYVPGVTVLVVFGPAVVDWGRAQIARVDALPVPWWVVVAILVGLFAAWWTYRWRRTRSRAVVDPSGPAER
jgi:phospholipase D1/2